MSRTASIQWFDTMNAALVTRTVWVRPGQPINRDWLLNELLLEDSKRSGVDSCGFTLDIFEPQGGDETVAFVARTTGLGPKPENNFAFPGVVFVYDQD